MTQTVAGWGRTAPAHVQVIPWRDGLDLNALGPVIARGAGRSYGDQAGCDGGAVLDMTRAARVERQADDVWIVDAGVTLRQLSDVALAANHVPPVCPGTGHVTVGGAIANDVHGKNHDRAGSIARHVVWLDLETPAEGTVRVTSDGDAELFAATLGGIGLTGIVRRVALRLLPVTGNAMLVEYRRINDLETFMAALVEGAATAAYSVGWIDALQRGSGFGRGILELAHHVDAPLAARAPLQLPLPLDLPGWVMNRHAVAAFNALYFRRVPARGARRHLDFRQFVFPLDAISNWNRLYGGRGVFQFQCVVGFERAAEVLTGMLARVVDSRSASFLAVLKTLGEGSVGMLSFPRPGFTLALDFPATAANRALVMQLNTMAAEAGGRVYLAKDATLTPELFSLMYPEHEAFRDVCARVDPQAVLVSDMARRLGLRR